MKNVITLVILAVTMIFAYAESVSAATPSFTTLQPGQFREINQNLPINIVFVGYHQGSGPRDINEAALQQLLPHGSSAINRIPQLYGLSSPAGVSFTYNYNFVYADANFENAYFTYLSGIAVPSARTEFQELYNHEAARSLDIGQNYRINATAPEKWLGDHAGPMLSVDTTKYTIFLINWFGRPDFKFHVYENPDEPDPDTGVNFATADNQFNLKDQLAFTAWGGTTPDDAETGLGSLHRIWYFDLSAGPESGSTNWDLTHADLNGDGQMEFRLPPTWEYGNTSGYRPFTDLSGDLGYITRFVAINLLFTASPVYKVSLSPPKLPTSIQLDFNLYEGDPQTDATTLFHPDRVIQKVSKLRPDNTFTAKLTDRPLAGTADRIFRCWIARASCYGNRFRGYSFADLYLYDYDHINQFVDGNADYEVPVFMYMTADSYWPPNTCQCSFAEDNYTDGSQSYVYVNSSHFFSRIGFGLSRTAIHEIGHHLGLSHPHDGYDSEMNVDYDDNMLWSAILGDESATVMGYNDVQLDFSQFDRDNMNRDLTAAYINQANVILAKVVASPRAGQVSTQLTAADQRAATALNAYQTMNYSAATSYAKDAYQRVLSAASSINVYVEPEASSADFKANGRSFKFADTADHWLHRH